MPSLERLLTEPLVLGLLLIVAVAAGLATLAATGLVRAQLVRRQVMDRPNERSSHAHPTPRGGGLAVIGVVLVGLAMMTGASFVVPGATAVPLIWIAGALVLAIVSFRDDVRPLPALLRLSVHAVAVAVALPPLLAVGPITQGIVPNWADALIAGLLWLAFTNFFNFMDGIDGISAVETATIGLGAVGLGLMTGIWAWMGPGALMVGVALGFLYWNWAPARIFLGDVGSVPLGFLLGGLLLLMAAAGFWATALILPSYYLGDAGLTLARRVARGEKIWQAHRSHFYQRAALAKEDHAVVSRGVALANSGLVVAGLAAVAWPIPALGGAVVIVGLLLLWMTRA